MKQENRPARVGIPVVHGREDVKFDDVLSRLTVGVDDDVRVARTAAESFASEGRRADWREQWSGSLDVGDELHILNDSTVTRHAERFDPARVLLEVALKRLILEQHSRVIVDEPDHWVTVPVCRECTKWGRQVHDYAPWPCDYIKALQAIYPDTTETEKS